MNAFFCTQQVLPDERDESLTHFCLPLPGPQPVPAVVIESHGSADGKSDSNEISLVPRSSSSSSRHTRSAGDSKHGGDAMDLSSDSGDAFEFGAPARLRFSITASAAKTTTPLMFSASRTLSSAQSSTALLHRTMAQLKHSVSCAADIFATYEAWLEAQYPYDSYKQVRKMRICASTGCGSWHCCAQC